MSASSAAICSNMRHSGPALSRGQSSKWSSPRQSSADWSSPHVSSGLNGGGPNRSKRLMRSEEHTSELQSRLHLVCRLLLEKKKKQHIQTKKSTANNARGAAHP